MPTYEYSCDRCGLVEHFQSIKDNALKVCPTCGSKKFQRMVTSGGGVIFKGGGFWETDYNRSADYKKKSADSGSKSKDASEAAPAPAPQPQPKLQPQSQPAPAPAAATKKSDPPSKSP